MRQDAADRCNPRATRPDGRSVCRSGTPGRLTRSTLWTTVGEQGGPNRNCTFVPLNAGANAGFHDVVHAGSESPAIDSGIATVVVVVSIEPFQSMREHVAADFPALPDPVFYRRSEMDAGIDPRLAVLARGFGELLYDRVMPAKGAPLVVMKAMSSSLKKLRSTSAAAPPRTLCVEG